MTLHAPSRRALLGATVWSVPAISLVSAAPAFASSSIGCGTYGVDLASAPTVVGTDPFTGVTTYVIPAVATVGGQIRKAEVVVTSRFFGNTKGAAGENMALAKQPVNLNGVPGAALRLQQEAKSQSDATNGYQDVTFTFPAEATDISMAIVDIDSNSEWKDVVSIEPAFTGVQSMVNIGTGSTAVPRVITGDGTTASPWAITGDMTNPDWEWSKTSGGTAFVSTINATRTAATTSFNLRFSNAVTGADKRRYHGVFIGAISFTVATNCIV